MKTQVAKNAARNQQPHQKNIPEVAAVFPTFLEVSFTFSARQAVSVQKTDIG